jgi:hypothetical protein
MHDDDFMRPERPWKGIEEYVHAYKLSLVAEKEVRQGPVHQWVNIKWATPCPGWCFLNTDGASKASERKTGCGGVLRRDNDKWVEGFAKALGDTTAYMAELWGYTKVCSLQIEEQWID